MSSSVETYRFKILHKQSLHCFFQTTVSLTGTLKYLVDYLSSQEPGRDAGRRKKTGRRRRIVIKEYLVCSRRKKISGEAAGWESSSEGPQSPGLMLSSCIETDRLMFMFPNTSQTESYCFLQTTVSLNGTLKYLVSLSPLRNLAVMSAEERRLAEKEGSLSKNTW